MVAESQGLTSGCGGTGKYKAAPGDGACSSCPAGAVATADRTACECDGGYEVCTADDDSQANSMTGGQGCSAFVTPYSGYDGTCVAQGACNTCCATCAAECAAAGVSTGCTACEAGERRALSRSSSAARVALPRVSWWQSLRA